MSNPHVRNPPIGLQAVLGAMLAILLAGCLELPKSALPVTARGVRPERETVPPPGSPAAQKAFRSQGGAGIRKIVPVEADFDTSEPSDDIESLLSDNPSDSHLDFPTKSIKQPSFAAGLLSPIDPESNFASIDGQSGDAPPANGTGRFFEPGSEGDDPSFEYSDDVPVEPFEPRISFKDDIVGLPLMFWNDARSIVTWPTAIVLGAAAGGALVIRDDLDQKVRYETAEHTLRWGQGSVTLRQFGEYSVQVPALAGVYALSLWTENDHLHEFSVAAFSAYGLTAISTVAIKGATNTSRPTTEFENGHYGFPSYHAASSFTIAAVIDEYYGWKVGLPAYALAGLVGWSRIDQREHDLSDVFFGSVLGFVIGKTVAAAHLDRRANLKITPYYDAQNRAAAVSLEKRF